jgi:hypothetical protein
MQGAGGQLMPEMRACLETRATARFVARSRCGARRTDGGKDPEPDRRIVVRAGDAQSALDAYDRAMAAAKMAQDAKQGVRWQFEGSIGDRAGEATTILEIAEGYNGLSRSRAPSQLGKGSSLCRQHNRNFRQPSPTATSMLKHTKMRMASDQAFPEEATGDPLKR